DNPDKVKLSKAKIKELVPVENEGFSRALARLGQRNLINYLQEQGYFFAKVTEKCDPADCSGDTPHVVYGVQPGQRYTLKEIKIEGTTVIKPSDVTGDLESKESSFIGSIPVVNGLPLIGGLARGITSDDRMRRDRDVVTQHMID